MSLVIALFSDFPWSRNGSAGFRFILSSWIGFSIAAVTLFSLDVSGMGNLVGRNVTFLKGMVALVTGMKTLHCWQWFIAGPLHHPWVPLSDQVVSLHSEGSSAMTFVPRGAGGMQQILKRPST